MLPSQHAAMRVKVDLRLSGIRAVATRAGSGHGLAAREALAAECFAPVTFSRSTEHSSKTKSLAGRHMDAADHSRAL